VPGSTRVLRRNDKEAKQKAWDADVPKHNQKWQPSNGTPKNPNVDCCKNRR
jgi:hypothetical protein